jgi:hypothetical protein
MEEQITKILKAVGEFEITYIGAARSGSDWYVAKGYTKEPKEKLEAFSHPLVRLFFNSSVKGFAFTAEFIPSELSANSLIPSSTQIKEPQPKPEKQ